MIPSVTKEKEKTGMPRVVSSLLTMVPFFFFVFAKANKIYKCLFVQLALALYTNIILMIIIANLMKVLKTPKLLCSRDFYKKTYFEI